MLIKHNLLGKFANSSKLLQHSAAHQRKRSVSYLDGPLDFRCIVDIGR